MRKYKGYQQDGRSYYTNKPTNSFPSGQNKTLEQFLADIDKEYDCRIQSAKKDYEEFERVMAKYNDWTLAELKQYCQDYMLWDVKFDKDSNIVPLETILVKLETQRERAKASRAYTYVKRITHKDNQKFVYNSTGGGDNHKVRIPSLKRSKAVWKRFYELFPYYKEHFNDLKDSLKLKKVW